MYVEHLSVINLLISLKSVEIRLLKLKTRLQMWDVFERFMETKGFQKQISNEFHNFTTKYSCCDFNFLKEILKITQTSW